MKINHILVDMDPTRDEQPALTKAIMLAQKFDASIELFLVEHQSALVINSFLDNDHLQKAIQGYLKSKQRWLDTYISEVVDAKIAVSTDVCWHKPIYEGIIQKAKRCKADLVIKSTHHHPTIHKVFFTPNDWQLLKSCPVPILLAKSDTASEYQHIMTAVDPSQSHGKAEDMDKIILDTGIEFANQLSAKSHVAHCYEAIGVELWKEVGVSVQGLETEAFDYKDYMQRLGATHNAQLENLIKNYQFSEENKHLEAGRPQVILPEMVDNYNIDLLVMGTSYHSGLIGSTAEKILDEVRCDVLAVKA